MIAKRVAQKLKLKPNTATDSFAKAFHNNPDYYRLGRQQYSRIYDNGAVGLEMYPYEDKWHLADIHVAPEHRGKGLAGQTLEEITQLADQHGVNMDLNVVPHGEGAGRLSKNQLYKWYARHGFQRIPYSMEPTKLSETMERAPKKVTQRLGARIKWIKTGDPDDPSDAFYSSADGRFDIEPKYQHTIRPSGYTLRDNQTKQTLSAYTLKDAREKAERILNPPKPIEITQEYMQAGYNKWMAMGYPDFAQQIVDKAKELGFTIKTDSSVPDASDRLP